jgi:hypothetical protein
MCQEMQKITKLSVFLLAIQLLAAVFSPWDCLAGESRFVRDENFSMEVRALPLGAVEAFLLARGFAPSLATKIVQQGCIHKLAVTHDGTGENLAVSIDLRAWRVRGLNGLWQPMIKRDDLSGRFADSQSSQPARMALNWAFFPSQQTFHPGDRIWGWAAMDLPPGTSFDLRMEWSTEKKVFKELVQGLLCAPQPPDSQPQGGKKP